MSTATPIPDGTFGEADLESDWPERPSRCSYPPEADWRAKDRDSDIYELTVPPGERPSSENLPGSIEQALLDVLDQVPRSPSAPELPEFAERYRR